MKNLTEFINEQLAEVVEEPVVEITEGKIESEQDFRDYAENKFKEAFGDDLDEDKMKKTIDGILDDNKDDFLAVLLFPGLVTYIDLVDKLDNISTILSHFELSAALTKSIIEICRAIITNQNLVFEIHFLHQNRF